MPTVTDIRPQKSGKRVNVYLDNQFGFGLDLENYVKLGLKIGQEFSQEKIEEIIKKAEFQKTLDKLLRFATLRPRSEKEVGDYLRRKKVHESLHGELFNRLKCLELINDEAFTRWWIEQRMQFKSKSKKDLEYELRMKGINKEIIEKVWGEVKIDDDKSARELLEKKSYKWQNLPIGKAKQKEKEFLA
ncbi:MAG: RecX family transcriptional regulator, partial [Candidatus Microgenomates bacterium]